MTEGSKVYPHVIPDMDQWPIYKLLDDRKNFIEEIDQYTFQRVVNLHGEELDDLIAKTAYMERIRMKEEPWKVDPPQDRVFWSKISRKLFGKPDEILSEQEKKAKEEELLRRIIHRYSDEIVGTFRIPTFQFARKFLTVLFNRLLNTAAGRNMKRIFGTKYKVYERLLTKGEVEKLRTLMTKGTVVIVPTHSSNLDSMLIGYAMDAIVGLPSFSYGAGLNLYNTGYTAYFMNRLGAYRVDRRKKNSIYLETLKAMSNLSIQRGTNSLFFPGGTRSRSGALEDKLKMGLLGTAMEAQRTNYQNGKNEKVFIVPLVLSYHFVLEAKYLIEQHLRFIGKEHYVRSKDDFYSLRKILKFGWTFFSQPSEITLSFGKPLDVLGNFVDEEGKSYDRFGKVVNLEEYFYANGKVTENLQREQEYTIMLAERLVERYHKENIVLTSHVVAYAAFNILRRLHDHLDLFGVLRLPPDEFVFPMEMMLDIVQQTKDILIQMNKESKIKLSNQVYFEAAELLKDGVRNLGVYHIEKPLEFENDVLMSQDFKLLFYYHNRLDNYKLNKRFSWNHQKNKAQIEAVS
ncbi:MAG: 1-acyl-sn-glycerol-3-phosphate acyltransferase [Saprospiraceae bacterium]|nr:1-acyl-sn-glycerol-3-phosphate acyltransferase [Saprospiraceae bacterium]